ncbi:hypothetical protein LCGC14_2826780 [marine sediment metagenome]|uniref:Transcription factor NikR nickel binding C-terminal domain-containing protein n=1 Tax=marine sediment metagenome TaxID=412755 RepID=A0A0F9B6F0_9ZZZZ
MKQVEFRIQTEDINRQKMIDLVSYHFSSYSIQVQLGYWIKQIENSVCFIIIATAKKRGIVEMVGRQIRDLNGQECVLITESPIKVKFI